MEENAVDKKKKSLFVVGVWMPMKEEPVHNGPYELQRAEPTADEIRKPHRVTWENGKWTGSVEGFVHWRGRELADITIHRRWRKRMKNYRLGNPATHAPAAKSAWLMARRAVGLELAGPAYRYYLVARAIDKSRVKRVDEEWMIQFAKDPANALLVEAQQVRVNTYFGKRGGRPSVVSGEPRQ